VIDARATILDRIEKALRTARIPQVGGDSAPHGPVKADSRQPGAVDPHDAPAARSTLLDRFVAEARALGVDVFVELSSPAVRERLASLTAGRRVLAWSADQLPYDVGPVIDNAVGGTAPRADQATADVGVTGCHGAIAETGSLALISKPGCTRTASLLPPLHVALVEPRTLFFAMDEFFAAHAGDIAAASNLTFVTGPSRTADIELSLTIGVHGPARVAVIVGPD
jgi:L-lactate dehydrogenase complex protein LldG